MCHSLVFESSGYVAVGEALQHGVGGQGEEGAGKGGESSASTHARRNSSSAVHYQYWNAAATISYSWDAFVVCTVPAAHE